MTKLLTITTPSSPRIRGVRNVMADGTAVEVLNKLTKTFEDFKVENDAKIDKINGQIDPLHSEKIDKISNEMTELEKLLKDMTADIAAMKIGGEGEAEGPEAKQHLTAFNKYFRKGVDNGLRDLEVKAKLTTESDPDGGFLVPHETEKNIDRVLGTTSIMRVIGNVMPMGAESYSKFVNVGGASSGWVGENDARAETDTPTLRELIFNMMELFAQPATTQRMLDAGIIDIAAWLADEVKTEFTETEGGAFILGNGVKKPRGILSYDAVENGSYQWGKIGYVATGAANGYIPPSTDDSPADAFIDLYYALKQGHRANATWLMSDATMGKIRKFKDNEGSYMWAPPSATGKVATILGKAVNTDDNMPAVQANSFSVAFADFKKAYLIIDRPGIRVLRDPLTQKGKVLFYTTKRVGGGCSNYEAIKLMKTATG
ncbi:MAG: phage major capsid protein [Robiginitomaculum sp.]|nr:MAG: phage major capsid protein [Robiginitomaculum sp.]